MTPQNNAISYTRAVATVFVILIHASTGFLNRFHAEGFDWNFANWINAATRCSVPLFVMISGALLLSKEEETFSFYKKRLPKLCWPFVFWTVIYMIYYFYRYTHFSTLSSQKIIAIIQDKILHGANAHLWFMYMIIGMYLAIPFVKKIVRQASMREIELFLVLWVVAMFITNKFYYPYTLKIDISFFSGYIGYLILGYYLSIKDFKVKFWWYLLGYVAILIFTAVMTYMWSSQERQFNPHWYNYVFPNTALAAICIFMLLQKTVSQDRPLPLWVQLTDKYSFGIYLVHILPLNYIHPMLSKHMNILWVIPLATLLTLLSSIGIIFLLRKLPYGKYVSG